VAEEKKAAKKAGAKKASSAKKGPGKKAAAKKAGPGAKKAGGAKKVASSAKRGGQPSHEEIAERAYHIYEREGGDSVEHWLRAERELSDE
jgi:hypothetical protein